MVKVEEEKKEVEGSEGGEEGKGGRSNNQGERKRRNGGSGGWWRVLADYLQQQRHGTEGFGQTAHDSSCVHTHTMSCLWHINTTTPRTRNGMRK